MRHERLEHQKISKRTPEGKNQEGDKDQEEPRESLREARVQGRARGPRQSQGRAEEELGKSQGRAREEPGKSQGRARRHRRKVRKICVSL